jgi:5-methylcytosine-specific restriction endonuclease McrA
MRNVERVAKPKVLTRNASKWKKDFLAALRRRDAVRASQLRSRYNHEEVREQLAEMYNNLCCYCEGQVGAVGANQLEHRKPVKLFPRLTFEWENLHLACAACNRAKSKKWNPRHPILDAAGSLKIANHLEYSSSEIGIWLEWRSFRGKTTVEHADLNRRKLCEARGRVFFGVFRVIHKIRDRLQTNPEDLAAANQIEELKARCSEQYGSMIRWALRDLLKPYIEIE